MRRVFGWEWGMWTSVLLVMQLLAASPMASSSSIVAERMLEAERLYESLDYGELVPVVLEVLEARGVDEETKIRAHFLHGAALAVIGATVEAEVPFRLLLRLDPNFEPDSMTSPKIVAVFSKVRFEEETIQASLEGIKMARILGEMSIRGGTSSTLMGGLPISFRYIVTDPRGLVESFFVHYRRADVPHYSSLALLQATDGGWQGSIPGEWTESELDYVLEYHLVTKDDRDNKLKALGSSYEPEKLDIAAGTIEEATPFYDRAWFWTVAGLAASALVGTTGYLLYERGQPQDGAAVLVLD